MEETPSNQPLPNQHQDQPTPMVVEPQWQHQSGSLTPVTPIQPPPNIQSQSDEPPVLAPSEVLPTTTPSPVSNVDAQVDKTISWNTSEFVNHQKAHSWYIYLGIVTILVAAVIYTLTRDLFSTIVIVVVAIVIGLTGALKPRLLDYAISPAGISISGKLYDYNNFRSFAVMNDTLSISIQLLPRQRFMVPIVMSLPIDNVDEIVKSLGNYLPLEPRERDLTDRLSTKLHL